MIWNVGKHLKKFKVSIMNYKIRVAHDFISYMCTYCPVLLQCVTIKFAAIKYSDQICTNIFTLLYGTHCSRVSCEKGPTRHAHAWQIGHFWQDTLFIKHCDTHFHVRILLRSRGWAYRHTYLLVSILFPIRHWGIIPDVPHLFGPRNRKQM